MLRRSSRAMSLTQCSIDRIADLLCRHFNRYRNCQPSRTPLHKHDVQTQASLPSPGRMFYCRRPSVLVNTCTSLQSFGCALTPSQTCFDSARNPGSTANTTPPEHQPTTRFTTTDTRVHSRVRCHHHFCFVRASSTGACGCGISREGRPPCHTDMRGFFTNLPCAPRLQKSPVCVTACAQDNYLLCRDELFL